MGDNMAWVRARAVHPQPCLPRDRRRSVVSTSSGTDATGKKSPRSCWLVRLAPCRYPRPASNLCDPCPSFRRSSDLHVVLGRREPIREVKSLLFVHWMYLSLHQVQFHSGWSWCRLRSCSQPGVRKLIRWCMVNVRRTEAYRSMQMVSFGPSLPAGQFCRCVSDLYRNASLLSSS